MINPNKNYKTNNLKNVGTITKMHGYLTAFTVTLNSGEVIDGFLDRCVNSPERFKEGTKVRITGVSWSITGDCWQVASMTKVR